MNDLHQSDFKQEGDFQWVAHKSGYRIVVRRYDGGYEIVIREELTQNPTDLDWKQALAAINKFYSDLRIAGQREGRDYRYGEHDDD